MPNFFERASAGISSLINDASVRARAAKSTTTALGKVGGEFGERLGRALQHAASLRKGKEKLETDELCDLQVGAHCYADSPGFMRTQLWQSLLDRAEREGTRAPERNAAGDAVEGLDGEDVLDDMCAILAADGYYETLRGAFDSTNALASEDASTSEQGASVKDKWNENVGATIERDLARTFPNHEFFASRTSKGADGRNALANILKAYAIHDSKVGYCQGMAFVAGLLLIYLSESRAFAAFVTIMEGSDFRSMYLHGMEGLKVRLRQLAVVLRAKNPALAQHLEKHDVAPVLYASGWFMSAFASEFPVRFSGRVMDCLLAQRSPSLIMRICVALLNEAAGDLLKLDDFELIVVYLKTEPRMWPRERLDAVMESALVMHDLTDEEVHRLDTDAAANDDIPRVISPSPVKRASTPSLIDVGGPTQSTEETAEEATLSGREDDKILDVLAMLDLDDWTTLDYDTEHSNSLDARHHCSDAASS